MDRPQRGLWVLRKRLRLVGQGGAHMNPSDVVLIALKRCGRPGGGGLRHKGWLVPWRDGA